NGITCNGCGFINTPRATLTTGTPTFTGSALTGLSVNAGDVLIEGLGLDASSATKFDIVTRATTINAQINAKDLAIHAGRQDFDYAARSGTAKADDGSVKPSFAIDSTALGGMYAGRITLVGTEAGLGVRVAGDMAASTGDMVLTADGKLELKSNLSAATDIALTSTASDISADKVIYARGNLSATANAGTVAANAGASYGVAGDVTIKAANVTAGAGGQIVAGMDGVGALTTGGTLDIRATTEIAMGEGFLGGGAHVFLKGPSVDLSRAVDDNTETVRSRDTLRIESGNLTATNGRIASDGAMELAGNSPIVLGPGLFSSTNTITLSGDSVTSAATITSDVAINITSTIGDITNTGSMSAGTSLSLNSAAGITNSGTLESQTGTLIVAATTLDNASGAKIKSAATTTVTTGGTLSNAGSIYAVNAATLTAPTITNTGSIAAGTNLDVNVGSFTNLAGVLHAGNNLTVGGYGGAARAVLFDNASGVVETVNGDITISADTIKNRKSAFSYTPRKYTSGQSGFGISGTLLSQFIGESSSETSPDPHYVYQLWNIYTPFGNYLGVFNSGPSAMVHYKTTISADSDIGTISSGQNIALTGTTISNDYSTISAVGYITITADTFSNEAAYLTDSLYGPSSRSCGQVDYHPSGWYCTNSGSFGLMATRVALSADALVQAGGDLTVNATRVGIGTDKPNLAPPIWNKKVEVASLQTTAIPSALLDTTKYADLIPGRDALFLESKDPTPTFLFETQVDFLSASNYYGSDYFINKLGGVKPEDISTRLGDAYFDTTLVKQAILQETGRRWLDNTVKDDTQQMKNLLDNAVTASGSLNLAFGIELSAAQITALTSDIVWYVEEEYEGRMVLVPKVYLASATRATMDDRGAILTGENVTITADTIDNDKSVIKANTDVSLTATNDITSNSAKIKAGNDITIASTTGDVNITTQLDTFTRAGMVQTIQHAKSTVDAGGKLTISAGGDISMLAAELKSGGDTSITAIGDLEVGTRTLVFNTNGKRNVDNVASNIKSGGALSLTSGGNARVQGSNLTATNDLTLQATGDVVVESVADSSLRVTDDYTLNTVTQRRSTLDAGGNITISSLVGNESLISSTLNSGGTIALNTPNGQLYLGARKDLYDYREKHVDEGMFISKYIDKGEIHETVVPTLLTANGNIAIVTANGTIIDYKDTGNLSQSIDQLSQAPGLAWMKDLQARNDVQWNAVQEAHKSWDYSSQGISPTGAVIIALAMAAVTGPGGFIKEGMGASLFSTSGTVTSAVANAGFTTLASTAATALVGNGGDIGAALKQLGSMDTLKSLATSMITAGLIASMPLGEMGITNSAADLEGLSGDALKMAQFSDKLKVAVANATVTATVDSVI
ncbi:MAG: DUF637 domain-containing protein, partial [Magnetovibrio sp.]|nr:DUF637 domain-containing protein [Magnetovibrio sp.]